MSEVTRMLDEIFQRIDRRDLFKELEPQDRGNHLVMRCPSCGDKKLFLYKNSRKLICNHRDHCGFTLSIWDYVQERDKLSQRETLEALAKYAGYDLPEASSERGRAYINALGRQEIIAKAVRISQELLFKTEGKATLKYLRSRGYTDEEIQRAGFGHYPARDSFKAMLGGDLSPADNQEFSIFAPKSLGDSHTMLIPSRDEWGRPEGFIVRSLLKDDKLKELGVQKYVVNFGYRRGDHLFNFSALDRDKKLIVVEGYIDALVAEAKGVEGVVSTGGAGLTEKQIDHVMGRGVRDFVLILDADKAGEKGTLSAIKLITAKGGRVYMTALPSGYKDPDELLRQGGGVEIFQEAVRNARAHYLHLLDQRFDRAEEAIASQGKLTDMEKDLLLNDVIALGGQTQTLLERDLLVQAFMERGAPLGITREALEQAITGLQVAREKEKKEKALRTGLETAQKLVDSGKTQEAQELLGGLGKMTDQLPAETFEALRIPVTEKEIREKVKDKPKNIPTGLSIRRDPLVIPSGAITIISAPTSHGKTAFQINLGLNMARNQENKPIHLFSYEENREAIVLKALNAYIQADLSKNNFRSIESYYRTGEEGYLKYDTLPLFHQKREAFFREIIEPGRLNIHYVDYSAEELVEAIRYLNKVSEVGAVIIDYMQLLRLRENRASSRQEELKQICLDLKDCAVDTGLPLILGAQFNREVSSRTAIHASRISEAGDIERIANLIIGLWNMNFAERDASGTPPQDDRMYAVILKGRDMRAGDHDYLEYDGNQGRIWNTVTDSEMD